MPAVGHFQVQSEAQFQSKRLYMSPDELTLFRNRDRNTPLTQGESDAMWAFYAKYGDLRVSIWYLEIVRRFIIISLLWNALPLIIFDLFSNKRVFMRLTKERIIYYDPWILIPVVTEKFVDWDNVTSIKLKKGALTGSRIVMCYTCTDEHVKKEQILYFNYKCCEASKDEMFCGIITFFDRHNIDRR